MRLPPRVGFSAPTAGCWLPRAAHGFRRPNPQLAACRAGQLPFTTTTTTCCPFAAAQSPVAPSSEFGSDFSLDWGLLVATPLCLVSPCGSGTVDHAGADGTSAMLAPGATDTAEHSLRPSQK
jgi:hypothetical protein